MPILDMRKLTATTRTLHACSTLSTAITLRVIGLTHSTSHPGKKLTVSRKYSSIRQSYSAEGIRQLVTGQMSHENSKKLSLL